MMLEDRYCFAPVNSLRLQVFCLKPELSYAISEQICDPLHPMSPPANVRNSDVINRKPGERHSSVRPGDLRPIQTRYNPHS